jgi:hypothetical protein
VELGGAAEFAAVEDDEGLMAALEDGFLQGDDFFLGVPEAPVVHAFGGENGEVVSPEGAGGESGRAEEDGLAGDELTAEEVDLDAIDLGEEFGDGKVAGDDGEWEDRAVAKFLGEEEDGGSGIEKADDAGLEEAAGVEGELAFASLIGPKALLEGREAAVVKRNGTAEGALDALFAFEDGQITAGGRFGDSEAATNFGDGEILALLQNRGEAFAPLLHNMVGNTHGQNLIPGELLAQPIGDFGSVRGMESFAGRQAV